MMKKVSVIMVGLLSLLYLANPTAGIFEFIPDNIPVIGNLDEATAAMLLISALNYFGINFDVFKKTEEKKAATKKVIDLGNK